MVALRDDVLRDEFSAARRGALWDVVRSLVEGNANVRSMVREARATGEVSRVWQWIGAVQRLESPGSGRRGSRRFSAGSGALGSVTGTPESRLLEGGDGRAGSYCGEDEGRAPEMKEMKRWTEGPSAYY